MQTQFILLIVILMSACSLDSEPCAELEQPTPEAPFCAPVQRCMAREAGYVWAGLQTAKVGKCTFYRYACVPEGHAAGETCEQRWETVCDRGDVDAPDAPSEGGE